jgi:hypothetical protein
MVYLADEPKQRLVLFVEPGRLDIGQHRFDERRVTKQLRRNCGVRFQSKRAMVTLRRVCRDQFADPRTQRCRPAEDFLSEASQVLSRCRQIREQVPDLRILGSLLLHLFDQCPVRAGLRILLDVWKEHWFHRLVILNWI